ncbi:hypothetical protein, partial [Nocardia sp. NPDC003979]
GGVRIREHENLARAGGVEIHAQLVSRFATKTKPAMNAEITDPIPAANGAKSFQDIPASSRSCLSCATCASHVITVALSHQNPATHSRSLDNRELPPTTPTLHLVIVIANSPTDLLTDHGPDPGDWTRSL